MRKLSFIFASLLMLFAFVTSAHSQASVTWKFLGTGANDTALVNHGVMIFTGNGAFSQSMTANSTTAGTTGQPLIGVTGSNPVWGAAPVKVILVTGDTTTSSTNVNAGGFSFAIAANETWQVEFGLVDSGIVKLGINAPSGATVAGLSTVGQVAITSIDGQTAAVTNHPDFVVATIVNGSTAGTVQLRFASTGSALIRPGSYMRATRFPY